MRYLLCPCVLILVTCTRTVNFLKTKYKYFLNLSLEPRMQCATRSSLEIVLYFHFDLYSNVFHSEHPLVRRAEVSRRLRRVCSSVPQLHWRAWVAGTCLSFTNKHFCRSGKDALDTCTIILKGKSQRKLAQIFLRKLAQVCSLRGWKSSMTYFTFIKYKTIDYITLVFMYVYNGIV